MCPVHGFVIIVLMTMDIGHACVIMTTIIIMTTTARRLGDQRANDIVMMMTMITMTTPGSSVRWSLSADNHFHKGNDFVEGQKCYSNDFDLIPMCLEIEECKTALIVLATHIPWWYWLQTQSICHPFKWIEDKQCLCVHIKHTLGWTLNIKLSNTDVSYKHRGGANPLKLNHIFSSASMHWFPAAW